jgi:hypothetical protein
MRSLRLALIILAALAPDLAQAQARTWRGVTPGATGQADLLQRFGEPSTRTKRGARTVLVYHGDLALEGTKQAQFHVDAAGTVQEITIFLAAPLDEETIEGTYGKPPQKTFVDETFQKVWLYPAKGVSVFFAKDGLVEALSFSPGKATGRGAAAGRAPASSAGAPAPADIPAPPPATTPASAAAPAGATTGAPGASTGVPREAPAAGAR